MEFLLAGPILRRVEPKTVSVWVACSETFTAKLSIWESNSPISAAGALPVATFESADTPSIRIGEKLFLCLMTITPTNNGSLNPISLYSYNVTFTKSGGTATLKTLGLLKDSPAAQKRKKVALGYEEDRLPTFILPAPTLENIKISHGSCRKAHGPGRETMVCLDFVIKKAWEDNSPTVRPQQLFLTGDQIYADEVASPLMKFIAPLANELMGKDERVTLVTGDIPISESNFPLCSRQNFMKETGKLTSDAAQNHLFSFGEFCVTYLMAWSNNIWTDESLDMTKIITDSAMNFLDNIIATNTLAHIPQSFKDALNTPEKRSTELKRRKKQYREELEAIIKFRDELPKIIRVLANVPVYMIMDDHEVTDDWFITKQWRQQVLAAPAGRAVVRNGLMAYSLFQDWGNVPSDYLSGDKKTLKDNIVAMFNPAATDFPDKTGGKVNATDGLLGLNNDDNPIKWHYSVQTGPTKTLFLDTRTRRQYDRQVSPPGLLKDDALTTQVPTPESLQNPEVIIIVSPAPVLGMSLFEEIIQPLNFQASKSATSRDYEAWSFNAPVFEKFLDRIQAFKKVILLSGDVHYSGSFLMDYFKKKKSPATGFSKSKIVQLISSACKNETDMVPSPLFISGRVNQIQAAALFPAERLGWKDKLNVTVNGSKTFSNAMRLKKEPVLLSPGPSWFPATTIAQEPDWAWSFDALRDNRPESERPLKIRMTIIDSDAELTTSPKTFYEKLMDRHIENSKKNVSRRFVWNNNLGMINLKKVGNEIVVEHELWHFLDDDGKDAEPQPYTVYKVNMAFAPDSARPTIP
jgi:hypothetical protein